MRCFHTTTYNINNENNIKIFIMNDIHFSEKIKDKKLNYIYNYIKRVNPNYVLIPGDLIDCVNKIENNIEKNRLFTWLKKIASISKILISIGNHDIFKVDKKKSYYYKLDSFYDELNNLDNVYVLDNNIYEDSNIYVCGITMDYNYYSDETLDKLNKELEKNKSILTNLPNKLRILLIHSPSNLDKTNLVKEFDYIICGHMHNGCVPPLLNEIWRSKKGIITPNKKFFGNNERNTLRKENDKILVNGPVITFQSVSGIMRIFNILFPTYISIMNFNKNNKFSIKKKYHKYK